MSLSTDSEKAIRKFFKTVEELDYEMPLEGELKCGRQEAERALHVTLTANYGYITRVWFSYYEVCNALSQEEDLRKLILNKFAVVINEEGFKEKLLEHRRVIAELEAKKEIDFLDDFVDRFIKA